MTSKEGNTGKRKAFCWGGVFRLFILKVVDIGV